MPTTPQIPEALIRVATSSRLNGFIVEALLCGFYTLLFAQAMWHLFCKGNKWIYMVVLSTLWGMIICGFAADWELLRLVFTVYNDTPSDMALHIIDTNDVMPKVDSILDSTFMILSILLGDGLLIWRVHLLWNDVKWNKYITTVFPLLITGTAVIGFIFWNPHSHLSHRTQGVLTGTFFLLSATTTFFGTSLIILRILLVSRKSRSPYSYRKVIEILVESSVVYSLGMVIIAITELILLRESTKPIGGYAVDELAVYAAAILTPLTGIAPTLIALRVGKQSRDMQGEETRPTPRLQFRRVNPAAPNTTVNAKGSRGVLSILRFARTNTTCSEETVNSKIYKVAEEVSEVKGGSGSLQDHNTGLGAENCSLGGHIV